MSQWSRGHLYTFFQRTKITKPGIFFKRVLVTLSPLWLGWILLQPPHFIVCHTRTMFTVVCHFISSEISKQHPETLPITKYYQRAMKQMLIAKVMATEKHPHLHLDWFLTSIDFTIEFYPTPGIKRSIHWKKNVGSFSPQRKSVCHWATKRERGFFPPVAIGGFSQVVESKMEE